MSSVLTVVRGAEFRTNFVWYDALGVAQDATGATVTAHLRHPWSHTPYSSAMTAGWSDPATGVGEVSMDEAQTALVARGELSELVITVVAPGDVTDIFVGGMVEGI